MPEMPTVRVLLTRVLGLLASLLLLLVLFAAALPVLIDVNAYRAPLKQALSQATSMDVELSALQLRSPLRNWGRPALVVERLRLSDPRLEEVALDAPHLSVSLEVWPLLRGRAVPQKVSVEQGNLLLHRTADGFWNWQPLLDQLNGRLHGVTVPLTAFELRNGIVTLVDDTPVNEASSIPATYRLTQTHLQLAQLTAEGSPLNLSAQFQEEAALVPLTVRGRISWQGNLDLQVRIAGLRPQRFRPYWQQWPGLRELDTAADLDWHLSGRWPDGLGITGSTHLSQLRWRWPQAFGDLPWQLADLKLDLNASFAPAQAQLQRLTLIADDWAALLSGQIRDLKPTLTPQVDLEIVTSWVDPYRARTSLPVTALQEPYQTWLQVASGSGEVRSELSLQGSVTHPAVRGIVEFHHLAVATPTLPQPLDALDGRLVLSDSAIELQDLHLRLVNSNLNLSGQVTPAQVQVQVQARGVHLEDLQGLLAARALEAIRRQLPRQRDRQGLADLDLQVLGPPTALEVSGQVALTGATLRPGDPQPVEFQPSTWQSVLLGTPDLASVAVDS